jgi:hypothetical protein
MALADAQAVIQTDWVAVFNQMPGSKQSTAVEGDPVVSYPSTASAPSPAPAQVAQPVAAAAPGDGHTFYASTYRTAHTIYCDNDRNGNS